MLLCLLFFLLCLCFPAIAGGGMKDGLLLVFGQVLPALYPFILLTTLFRYLAERSDAGRYLSIFIGFLSGYPLGARAAADFKSSKNRITSQSLLLICNNPSPAYMISFIGLHCFNDPRLGLSMYMAILGGNLAAGLIFNPFHRKKDADLIHFTSYLQSKKLSEKGIPESNLLDMVIHDTFSIIVSISGYVLIFSTAAAFIRHLALLPPAAQALTAGLLEMTTGIQMLASQAAVSSTSKILITTWLISFGGLSVIAQTAGMIGKSSLSIKKYTTEKAIAATIAVSVMYIYITLCL